MKESLNLWRKIKNPEDEAYILCMLSLSYGTSGDTDTGIKYGKESLELAEKAGNEAIINFSKISVCQCLVDQKRMDEARNMAQQILEGAQKFDQPMTARLGNHFLADTNLMENNPIEAERNYGAALVVASRIKSVMFINIELLGVAMSVAAQSRLPKAIRLSAAASAYALDNKNMPPEALQLGFWKEFHEKYIVTARTSLGEGLTLKYEDEGKSMTIQEAICYALDYEKD
jgi:hypothetical protein